MKIIALNTYTPDINDFAYEWNPKRLCKASARRFSLLLNLLPKR